MKVALAVYKSEEILETFTMKQIRREIRRERAIGILMVLIGFMCGFLVGGFFVYYTGI